MVLFFGVLHAVEVKYFIKLPHNTPVLPPKEKEQRKKEIERCLYEVFSKYGDRFP